MLSFQVKKKIHPTIVENIFNFSNQRHENFKETRICGGVIVKEKSNCTIPIWRIHVVLFVNNTVAFPPFRNAIQKNVRNPTNVFMVH